jgi:hypothetical protein
VLALLLALTIAFFAPVFFQGKTYSILAEYSDAVYPWAALPNPHHLDHPQTDYAELSYPWLVSSKAAWDDGAFPFWSPDAYGGGYDVYANGSSAVLYPPRLAALLATSPVRAHDLFSIFHVLASGVAMVLLARDLSLGRRAATFAGVAWMFATWNMAWLHLEVVTPMALFLPLSFLLVRKVARGSWRWAIGAGLLLGVVPGAGHLLFLGLVLVAAAIYGAALVIGRIARAPRPQRRREAISATARLALCFGLVVGVAAVVLLPTAMALSGGQRASLGYDRLRALDLLGRPSMFWKLLVPPDPVTADNMQYMGFVGSATGVLAIVGALSRRRPGAWAGRLLVAVTFLVAVGTPLTWLAYHVVPGMKVFRPYYRLTVFAAFGVALLGAIGLQAVLDRFERPHGAHARPRRTGARWAWALTAVVVGATAVQLIVIGHRVNPAFAPHAAQYTLGRTAIVERVEADASTSTGWPARVLPVMVENTEGKPMFPVLYANTPLAMGLDTTSGYDSSIERRVVNLSRVLTGEDPATIGDGRTFGAYNAVFFSTRTRFDLARRLGVSAIVTAPPRDGFVETWGPTWDGLGATRTYREVDGDVFTVPDALVGPRLVRADEVVAGERAALLRFTEPAFPYETTALIEADELRRSGLGPLGAAQPAPDGGGPAAGAAPASTAGTVTAASRGVNTVSVDVTADGPSWLIVPDAWAEGWSATVNGRSAPVVRVNYDQRAVRVEAGASTVRMRYRSPGFDAGAALSVASVLGGVVALVVGTVLGRRRRDAQGDGRGDVELEQQLVAEEARVHGDADAVGPLDEAPSETGGVALGEHVER